MAKDTKNLRLLAEKVRRSPAFALAHEIMALRETCEKLINDVSKMQDGLMEYLVDDLAIQKDIDYIDSCK